MTNQPAVLDRAQVQRVSSLVRDLARCDVAALAEGDFLGVLDDVATLGRLTDALRARVAGDAARRSTPDQVGGGLARRQGFGNAASMVASVTGGSQAGAWRAIEAGRAFIAEPVLPSEASDRLDLSDDQPPTPPTPRYPAITTASMAGVLSTDVAAIITGGLERLTDRVPSDQVHALEQRLVAKAQLLGLREVRRLVAREVAKADLAGHMESEKRQHAERYL
ncbi:hypothetical protein, partial [Demequina sp.]|uniref:hypothetical protein n=1 Tax=Demequina sp. TaxID=2050685 RepID=UPI0025BBB0C1